LQCFQNWLPQLLVVPFPTDSPHKKSRLRTQLLNLTVTKWPESSGPPLRMNWSILSWTSTSNISISELSTETRLMTRSLLMLPKPSRTARSESNAPPSLPMRPESKSSNSKRCGRVPTVASETTSTELSSENPFFARTSQDWSPTGPSPSLSVDMPSETSITALTSWSLNPETLLLTSKEKPTNWTSQSTSSQDQESDYWCSITTAQLKHSLTPASSMPWTETIPSTWPLRTLSSRSMMVDSRISSKKSINQPTNLNSKPKNYGMNID